ncbi:MAG: hypothetical protein RQ756_08885, partial [Flavobacteriaceae bacterium]|nr:hypothetical protein [Flavobacteriaceae bacterium]
MKRIFILLMFCFISNEVFGQAQTKWWYFGSFAGVEFLPAGPIANNQGALTTIEGCASIADRCGQLQFYTDGSTAWNRNHSIMLNGVGLGGNSSSTQSGIIVPRPNDDNDRIYYLISVNTTGNVTYNVVDMTLDGGLGGVVVNPPRRINNVINNGAEKLTAVASPDGNTVWVLLFSNSTGTGTPFNSIHAFPITSAGINIAGQITTTFPSLPNITDRRGYMQLSPNGTKLAVVTHAPASAFMFDFNPTTGIPSNPTTINSSLGQQNLYGAAFSRDNNKFYLDTNSAGGNGIGTRTLLQYDLTQTNYQNSPATVPGATNVTGEGRGALQLGIDCKIYHARKHPWLAVLDNPNQPAALLNYTNNGVALTANGNEGLPPFLSSLLAEVDFNLT